jgi:hypothetical protein
MTAVNEIREPGFSPVIAISFFRAATVRAVRERFVVAPGTAC